MRFSWNYGRRGIKNAGNDKGIGQWKKEKPAAVRLIRSKTRLVINESSRRSNVQLQPVGCFPVSSFLMTGWTSTLCAVCVVRRDWAVAAHCFEDTWPKRSGKKWWLTNRRGNGACAHWESRRWLVFFLTSWPVRCPQKMQSILAPQHGSWTLWPARVNWGPSMFWGKWAWWPCLCLHKPLIPIFIEILYIFKNDKKYGKKQKQSLGYGYKKTC